MSWVSLEGLTAGERWWKNGRLQRNQSQKTTKSRQSESLLISFFLIFSVCELFRCQAKIGRSKRWTHFNDRLHIDVPDTSKQRHETLSTILGILRRLDTVAMSSLDMSEINYVDPEGKEGLYKDLSDLQEQVHQLQKGAAEDPKPISCADFFYWYDLVRSLVQLIRRPNRTFNLYEILVSRSSFFIKWKF